MRVLVVHDRQEVGDEIVAIVTSHEEVQDVVSVGDAQSARDQMHANFFDVMFIDLTIPSVKGRSAVGYAVAEGLLEEVFSPGGILTPANVVGITREPDALMRVQNNIGPHLMAIVHEDDDGHWRKQIADRLTYIATSQVARSRAHLTKFNYDLLILTALDKEFKPLKDVFELTPVDNMRGVSEFVFQDKSGVTRRGVCSAIGRAGQPSAASEAQALISICKPKLAMLIGFCGGIPGKTELGDILIAEIAVDWDYGKWKPSELASQLYSRPEPITIRNSRAHLSARSIVEGGVAMIPNLRDRIFSMSKGEIDKPAIRLVPFASGSAVIGADSVIASIQQLNEGIGGVDMESYGFYFACSYPLTAKPEFICIKAVADHCGPDKDDRLHEVCCFSSAQLARHLVAVEWDFSR